MTLLMSPALPLSHSPVLLPLPSLLGISLIMLSVYSTFSRTTPVAIFFFVDLLMPLRLEPPSTKVWYKSTTVEEAVVDHEEEYERWGCRLGVARLSVGVSRWSEEMPWRRIFDPHRATYWSEVVYTVSVRTNLVQLDTACR
ncbi:hypothetical protein CPB84DRAFT_1748837 [Gymnopilus junonius]|uniref:Uncharacterized protein n=1 Tax=Gymnopilus junonius TaxID=109634 RepID=A0A9P5NK09_GYMJU|nr:hypothetical protein CPB84DRAFT_1748837 [Gymnopilus junonius]